MLPPGSALRIPTGNCENAKASENAKRTSVQPVIPGQCPIIRPDFAFSRPFAFSQFPVGVSRRSAFRLSMRSGGTTLAEAARISVEGTPNPRRRLEIQVGAQTYLRIPIHTHVVTDADDIVDVIAR